MKAPGLDYGTQASDPGDIHLSHDKLKEFHPDLYETQKIMGATRLKRVIIFSP